MYIRNTDPQKRLNNWITRIEILSDLVLIDLKSKSRFSEANHMLQITYSLWSKSVRVSFVKMQILIIAVLNYLVGDERKNKIIHAKNFFRALVPTTNQLIRYSPMKEI